MKFVSSLVILLLLTVCSYATSESSSSDDFWDSSDSEPLSSSQVGKQLLSIKNYQYSLIECGSDSGSHGGGGHLHIFCEPYDFIGEVYIQFGECVGYRGLNTIFSVVTHEGHNDWINQTNYENYNCQGEIQSYRLMRSQYCYGGCTHDPVIVTIIDQSEIEPVVNSFSQILSSGCNGQQNNDFIIQDNIILDTCINYLEGHSIQFACNSTTVSLSQYSAWNCVGTAIHNEAPTGNVCSDNFDIDTVCNSAPPTPTPSPTQPTKFNIK